MRLLDLNKQAQRALWRARTDWSQQVSMLPVLTSMLGLAGVFCAAVIYLLPRGNSPGTILGIAGAIAGGVIIVYAVLRNPWWVLLGVVLIRPSIDHVAQGPGNAALAVAILLIGLVYLPVVARSEQVAIRSACPPFVLVHLALMGWSFLGFAYTERLAFGGWEAYLRQATIIVVALMAAREAHTPQHRRAALLVALLSNLPLLVMASYGAATHTGYRAEGDGALRLTAPYMIDAPYGLACVVGAGVTVALALFSADSARAVRITAAIWALWSTPLLILMQTRTMWLALAIVCFVIASATRRWRILSVAALVILAVLAVLGPSILHRVGALSVASERGNLWRETFSIAVASPILGHGPGDVVTITQPDGSRVASMVEPHNDYIRLAIWAGAIGPVLYVVMLALILKQGWAVWCGARTQDDRVLGLATVGVVTVQAVMSLTGNCIALPFIMIGNSFLYGICAAARQGMQESDEEGLARDGTRPLTRLGVRPMGPAAQGPRRGRARPPGVVRKLS
jgi:O-antigen ligase